MDCSPPGSSVHGILQARILEWVAISSSRGSFRSRDSNLHLISPALAAGFFTTNYYSHLTENRLRGVQHPQNSKWGNLNQSWSFLFLLYHTLLISITDTKNINNLTLASIYSPYKISGHQWREIRVDPALAIQLLFHSCVWTVTLSSRWTMHPVKRHIKTVG